jgi:hypothetical protein
MNLSVWIFGYQRLSFSFSFSGPSGTVNEGDRVAQLILERIVTPEVVEVDVSWLPGLSASATFGQADQPVLPTCLCHSVASSFRYCHRILTLLPEEQAASVLPAASALQRTVWEQAWLVSLLLLLRRRRCRVYKVTIEVQVVKSEKTSQRRHTGIPVMILR